MNDMIIKAAQDPSCILAVTPDRGGSWWAALRPDTPRNFAENPMTWTDAVVAGYAAIGDHDCEFEISYKNNVDYPGQIFYSISQDGSINLNQIENNQNSYSAFRAFNGEYPDVVITLDAGVQNSGSHIVKFKRQNGTAEAWVDGKLVKSVTSDLGNKTLYANNMPLSHFDGSIFYIRLTDLTTGETVWQASHDELYETNNPWPFSVPENFAENAHAFYDCQAVVQEAIDPTHDYRFLIEAEIVRENPECSMFYAGGDKFPFGVYAYSDNTIRVFSNLLRSAIDTSSKYATVVAYSEDTRLQGRHTIELRIEGDAMRVFLDGNEIEHSYTFARTGTTTVGLPQCNSGYVYKIQIEDLTTGRTVWSYPTEAERVRLLTKTNVRTDRGVFEAADTSKRWSVTTQLRASSLLPACTIIVDVNNPNDEFVSFVSCAQLPNPAQGFFVIRRQNSSQLYIGYSGRDGSGGNFYPGYYMSSPDSECTVALVIDYTSMKICCYVNGIEVDNRTMHTTIVAPPEFDETAKPVILGVTSGSDGLNSTTKISHCLIFDRALTAAEIAALTPKKQLLSWAGIQDVVRRGRAENYFSVGDVIEVKTPRWTIEYEVVGFDQIKPADAALTHSMTLLPVNLITELQFDAPEPENPDLNRSKHGCNRWDWSAVRQWLNSAAAPGEWWTAQHEYDASPDYAATMAGFMADLPADFLSAVAPARLTTALPNADGGGSVETVDRFWLPSRTEIFGDANNGVAEGVLMTKYIDATDADRIKYNAAGNPASWYLRSAYTSQTHYVAFVGATGIYSTSFLVKWRVAAACIIA